MDKTMFETVSEPMRRLRIPHNVFRAFIALVLLTACGAQAQNAGKYASEVAQAKQFADEGRDQIGLLEFEGSELGDIGAADVVEAKKFFAQYVAAWENAGTLFAEGRIDEANKAREAGFRLVGGRNRWRERFTIRRQQLQATPNAQAIERERAGVPPQTLKQYDQYVEAMKGLSDTFASLADATTPDATEGDLMKHRFKITAAMADRDIAHARLSWAREIAGTRSERGVSPQIDEKLDALQQVQDEIATAQRERMRLENAVGASEMDRKRLMDELRQLADADRRARESGQKKQ